MHFEPRLYWPHSQGAKPGNLPTKVELFINLKAAKALGISVPLPLIGRADEVIE